MRNAQKAKGKLEKYIFGKIDIFKYLGMMLDEKQIGIIARIPITGY